MTRRLLDTVRGTGTIHASGELIRKTTYEISIWSGGSPKDDDHPGTLPNIDGHIDITGMAEAIVLAGPGTLTLTLEDGRRLSFRLTGTGGSIVGLGWLP